MSLPISTETEEFIQLLKPKEKKKNLHWESWKQTSKKKKSAGEKGRRGVQDISLTIINNLGGEILPMSKLKRN